MDFGGYECLVMPILLLVFMGIGELVNGHFGIRGTGRFNAMTGLGVVALPILLIVFIVGSITNGVQPTMQKFGLAKSPTATFVPPTKTPQPLPTRFVFTWHDIKCRLYKDVDRSDIDQQICIFGTTIDSKTTWNSFRFSTDPNALFVIDYNFFYTTPIIQGECMIVYGRVRDIGQGILVITPNKDFKDSVSSYGLGMSECVGN